MCFLFFFHSFYARAHARAHTTPASAAPLIRTQNSTRNGYLFLRCVFYHLPTPTSLFPFVELFLSAIPLIRHNNDSQVGQDNAVSWRRRLGLAADRRQRGGATGTVLNNPSGPNSSKKKVGGGHKVIPGFCRSGTELPSFIFRGDAPMAGFLQND